VVKLLPGTEVLPFVPVASTWFVVDSVRYVEVFAFLIFNLFAGIDGPMPRPLSSENTDEAALTLICQFLLLFIVIVEKLRTVFPYFTSLIVVSERLAVGFDTETENIGLTVMLPLPVSYC
jgi:hypothetical protein